MNINVTIERIDSCKLFNKMNEKIFTKEKNALLTNLRIAYNLRCSPG